ncbi:MAG TPA: hypothetical protein VMR31_05745 [Myxococcota bacterium]|nr:hypothetical protein [Myxococcota bacterium]
MSLRTVVGLLAAVALAGAARADSPAAQVVALEGRATADAADLAIGDSIVAGSVIRTAADSRVGVFAGEIYVQLDPQSALRLERDAGGHVTMTLQEGRARIVDTRGAGDPAALRVDSAKSTIATNGDSEVYILNEKAGRYAMFCDWKGPVQVTRNPKSLHADPGHCVLSKPHEDLYAANGHDHQIPLLPLPNDAALFDAPANHFDTTDVAAGPPGFGFGDPVSPIERQRDPCDVPGSGCIAQTGLRVVEPPPVTGGCAPGVVCGPPAPPPPPPVVVSEPPGGGAGCGGMPGPGPRGGR